MKKFTLTTVLLATALSLATHAAPPPAPTSTPMNGTVTEDSALLKLIVDYDEKAAAALIAKYDAAFKGTKSPPQSNSASRAAAPSSNVIPFCVGLAQNPVRNQVFSNKVKCDQDGWKTLFVFTAFAQPDPYQGFNKTCVAYATNPVRSLLFFDTLSCTKGEWTTDFNFYQSDCKPSDTDLNCIRRQSATVMWQAYEPHRILLYPWYWGQQHGWKDPVPIRYIAQWRYAKEAEWKSLQDVMAIHAVLHSRTTITATPDDPTRRCLRNLFQLFPWGTIPTAGVSWPAIAHPLFPVAADRDACSRLSAKTSFEINPKIYEGHASINAVIGGKIYASVTVPVGAKFNRQLVPLAFEESLRTKFPVPFGSVITRPEAIVAMVQKKFIVMGGPEAYVGASDLPDLPTRS
ncbi:hypothetical protein K457DRAFT_128530 [Linnemannia elongata AG-77]|uniref:Uncharacterized protein n=1 Tax=Linnemannia elongata AG-77 TaxID=1314771 RepID=A0A197JM57_9FUNG|nr:hypothetical protein K457DRAFT_128530 [Linnemannia elongata AG-77]